MIDAEGYTISGRCDGTHEVEMPYGLWYGVNKRDALRELRESGWVIRMGGLFCPQCAKQRKLYRRGK